MGIMFPAVLHFTRTEVHFGKSELALSRFSSCVMLIAYASYLFFQLKSQVNLYNPFDEVSSFPPWAFRGSSMIVELSIHLIAFWLFHFPFIPLHHDCKLVFKFKCFSSRFWFHQEGVMSCCWKEEYKLFNMLFDLLLEIKSLYCTMQCCFSSEFMEGIIYCHGCCAVKKPAIVHNLC